MLNREVDFFLTVLRRSSKSPAAINTHGSCLKTGSMRLLLLAISLGVFVTGCGDGYLRGSAEPSPDGKTYLAVVDDNGGGCGPIKMDGKIWVHPIGQPGMISPGTHIIECGGRIEFVVPAGVIFKFDYWGP